ncbi:DNA polymerase kappa, partial [Tremellales sp. Uapishka_1]
MSATSPKGKGKAAEMTEEERFKAEAQKKSFERSLAGPSVGKAGLMRDQEEVNRIIAEASKVDTIVLRRRDLTRIARKRYYVNQVKKDKELTEKITWFQNKRDEMMKTANIQRLEADAERILMEVEATRDLTQTIVHVDMDAFYASVEVKQDPSLKGKPFGVGIGVLTTASYEARKFGCRSGMAGFVAKKLCPQLIQVPCNFELYIAASKSVREVLLQYDENLMMASLDEGYLNITSYMSSHSMTAKETIDQLRAEVEAKTGLTISAGIAANRMLAKICSDKNKPNGQFQLEFERTAITRFMRDLPVRRIPGFGRVTERCLEGLGVETCGDIYEKRVELLAMDHWFGFRGLCKAFLGIASNVVEPGKREERKSVGVEKTFRDKTDDEDIMKTLEELVEELGKDLERLKYAGKTVTVKFKLHTFQNKTRALSIKKFVSTAEDILPIARELMKKELPVKIRLLGVRLSTLKDLTIPDQGVRPFFTSPSKKSSRSASASRAKSSEADNSDDFTILEDDNELQEWKEESDFLPPANEQVLGKRKSTSPDAMPTTEKKHTLGPVCPICAKTLGPSTSNQGLNEHIDRCLNTEAISEASKRTPKKKRKEKDKISGPVAGSMMEWLSKGQGRFLRTALAEAGYTSLAQLSGVTEGDLATELNIGLAQAEDILRQVQTLRAGPSQHAQPNHASPILQSRPGIHSATATSLLSSTALPRFSTFSSSIDSLISRVAPLDPKGKGKEKGYITPGMSIEIAGPPGIGKTAMCVGIVMSARLRRREMDTPDQVGEPIVEDVGEVLIVDTEGGLTPDRIYKAAVSLSKTTAASLESILRGIHSMRIATQVQMIAFIHTLDGWLEEHPKVDLIIIDTLSYHFRQPTLDINARRRLMELVKLKIGKATIVHRCAVVVTNQLATKMRNAEGKPATFDDGARAFLMTQLGDLWTTSKTLRLLLFRGSKGDERRYCHISTGGMGDQDVPWANFNIDPDGLPSDS